MTTATTRGAPPKTLLRKVSTRKKENVIRWSRGHRRGSVPKRIKEKWF